MVPPGTFQTATDSVSTEARDLATLSTTMVEELRQSCQVPWAHVQLSESLVAMIGMPPAPSCAPEYAPWVRAVLDQGEPVHVGAHRSTAQAPGFFAGVPVRSRDGRLLGAVSIGAPDPRPFGAGQQRSLQLAAHHLAARIELLELREQPEPFQIFVDSMPAVFYVINEQSRLLRWNQRLLEITGRDPASLPGMDPLELFAVEHRAHAGHLHEQAFSTGRAQGEVRLRGADALSRPHLLTCQRLDLTGRTYIVSMGQIGRAHV